MNKGELIKNDKGEWELKCTDLHGYGQGYSYHYLKLSDKSNVIKYVENGELRIKPLEEGCRVDYKTITLGYDQVEFLPIQVAELVFPEYDKLFVELNIKDYLTNGGELFIIKNIDRIRDGGTIKIETTKDPYYVHQKNFTVHYQHPDNSYPIGDEQELIYLMDRLKKYKETKEMELKNLKNLIENIKTYV